MLNRLCSRIALPTPGRALRPLLAAVFVAAAAGPSPALAGALPDPLQPLGIVGDASRPSCTSPFGPLEPGDTLPTDPGEYEELGDSLPATGEDTEIAALTGGFELLPTLGICSPTFPGIPGAVGGTIASGPKRTRVGVGWRELGGSFAQPAALTPGDTITLPEVDDAAQVRLSVARDADRPAATIRLTDLFPGPSTVAIGEDARGLVATLTRADGTTSEGVVRPTLPPTLSAKVSGSRKRWTVRLNLLPGSFAYGSYFSQSGGYDDGAAYATASAAGQANFVLRPKQRKNRRLSLLLRGLAFNREAHTITAFVCDVQGNRKGRPVRSTCTPTPTDDYFEDNEDAEDPYDDWGSIATFVQRMTGNGSRLASAARRLTLPQPARAAEDATIARRNAVMGRTKAAVTAPLVAREIPLAPAVVAAGLDGLRPLAADVNGDGAPDFWTDSRPDASSWWPTFRKSAGYVLVSSPAGLIARRVDLPTEDGAPGEVVDSEISAIADITGDGVGELVVDLDEQHALIPGSRSWTGSTAPIRAPEPTELAPGDRLLHPAVSSPGSPYAAIDDASGDGLRDLVATDDLGGWYSIAGSQIRSGSITRLPSVARAIQVPLAVKETLGFEPAAPRVDPRVRVIAGQAVTLRWPVVASVKAPEGSVEIAVRTATGAAVRPSVTVKTPGNAVLLDYDRISGEFLLLSVGANCAKGDDYFDRRCRESFLRVRADGSVRQSFTVDPRTSIAYVGAARFVSDGPDADSDVDVVFTVGNQALGVAASTLPGALKEKSLPVVRLGGIDRPFYEELRLIPVVEPSGARKLTVALPSAAASRTFDLSGAYARPAEIVWK